MTTCSISVSLEHEGGKEGTDGEVIEPPPQPDKTKGPNCATAVAAPNFSSSLRVKCRINLTFGCALLTKGRTRPPGKRNQETGIVV